MAGSLATQNKDSKGLTKLQRAYVEGLSAGQSRAEIAKRLAKGDRELARQLRRRFRRMERNPQIQQEVMLRAREKGLQYLAPSVEGVGQRAARGRPDAAKLLWSMMGFHSEKVNHDHSGEIKINVSIPRPQQTQDQLGPGNQGESYVDAEVVEEE